mmetsp:Transcript_20868/g.48110  ORF Transcript_20868/g.48110 Transcript_20868/m.48110 type:complete len:151 (-) Transcript_20868:419-871(-)
MEKGSATSGFGELAQMDSLLRKLHPHPEKYKQFKVPSAPLGQLLRMVGVVSIDLFSLDVEGAEAKVLRTFDWSIPVRVWCIEVSSREKSDEIGVLMRSHGYRREQWLGIKAMSNGTGTDAPINRVWNELWVWGSEWKPQEYQWHQFVAPA